MPFSHHPINIIGGSGFIGSALTRLLMQENASSVRIVDKVQSSLFPSLSTIADVRDRTGLESALLHDSVIVHLAAEHRDDVRPSSLYHDVNVIGARNVCDAARATRAGTIIFTSTVAVYGFARAGTDESGALAPFNEYGRTKMEAEQVFREWQREAPASRCLVILRPTVVFGEGNRGNVYNLLKQIASGRFLMIGNGRNRKSMAYVENVAAFIRYSMKSAPGIHVYNYVDPPDFTMNELVDAVHQSLGRRNPCSFRIPFAAGYTIGRLLDFASRLTGKSCSISAVRIRKFCSDSVYHSRVDETGFVRPVPLEQALARTIRHEFPQIASDNHKRDGNHTAVPTAGPR